MTRKARMSMLAEGRPGLGRNPAQNRNCIPGPEAGGFGHAGACSAGLGAESKRRRRSSLLPEERNCEPSADRSGEQVDQGLAWLARVGASPRGPWSPS